jgi:hypothetical protein
MNKKTPQKLADRGRTVMRVTNPEILLKLDTMLTELKSSIQCKRRPGIQIGLDCLLQFWFRSNPMMRAAFLKRWRTPVVGYPNSTRQNPGQFARLKDLPQATEAETEAAEPVLTPAEVVELSPKDWDEWAEKVDPELAKDMKPDDTTPYQEPDSETYDPGRLD